MLPRKTGGGVSVRCPECGVWTEVLATRFKPETNTTHRQRRCGNLHRFYTVETVQTSLKTEKKRSPNGE